MEVHHTESITYVQMFTGKGTAALVVTNSLPLKCMVSVQFMTWLFMTKVIFDHSLSFLLTSTVKFL